MFVKTYEKCGKFIGCRLPANSVKKWLIFNKLNYRLMSTEKDAQGNSSSEPLVLLKDCPIVDVQFNPFLPMLNFARLVWYTYKYDQKFSYGDKFMNTTRQAFALLTNKLSNKEFEDVKDMVIPELYNTLKDSVERLTEDQRSKMLSLVETDIYLGYIYNCSFRNDRVNAAVRFFDIYIVYSCMRNMENSKKEMDAMFVKKSSDKDTKMPSISLNDVRNFMKNRTVTANFTLTKKIAPQSDADWTVSYVNYRVS